MERRAYKYRVYPTDEPARELTRILGCVRYVYNGALALRTQAWFDRHERIDYAGTDRLLVRMKKKPETSWLAAVACVPLQLNAAFVNFCAGRAKYLHFHCKHDQQGATHRIGGFRWNDGNLTRAKMDTPLDIRWTRPAGAEPTNVTVRRDPAGRSFISFSTKEEITPLPVVNATARTDIGLLDTVPRSTGEKVGSERFFRRDEKRLPKAQVRLARTCKDTRTRAKTRHKVARIADRRWDFTYKRGTRIVRENQVVCAERLNVKGMLANPTLTKSIAVGSGERLRHGEYKAQWYCRRFLPISRFCPSSKRCHACGPLLEHLPLTMRYCECPVCGAALDRDVNAAQNIRDAGRAEWVAGLVVAAYGGDGRPNRKRAGGPRRSRNSR